MIQFIKEGEVVRNGISFYTLNDKASFGFKIRYGRRIPGTNLRQNLLMVRYSKGGKKWFVEKHKLAGASNGR